MVVVASPLPVAVTSTDSILPKLQEQVQYSCNFNINIIGDCEWFLGMHIIQDRKTRTLRLSQASYIDKIADHFIGETPRSISTPMSQE